MDEDVLQEPRPQVIKESLLEIGMKEGFTDAERKKLEAIKQENERRIKEQKAPIKSSDSPPDIRVLSLCFMHIRKIDNLQAYTNLKELYLANNLITKIENLSSLTSLTKLDLSFNQICDVDENNHPINAFEGIEGLVNLEELSLFKNGITRLDTFPNFPKLRYLSLGKNKVSELGEIQHLYKLKSLRILTLADNPIAGKDICKLTVLAYLPGLRFLDYSRVTKTDITDAKERHSDQLNQLQQTEDLEKMQKDNERAQDARARTHREAFLNKIADLHLSLFKKDNDHAKIRTITEIAEPYMRFVDDLKKTIEGFINDVITQSRMLKEEEELFQQAYLTVTEQNRLEMVQIVKKLERKRRRFMDLFNHEEDATNDESRDDYNSFTKDSTLTQDQLMTSEFALIDMVAEMIRFYETELDERFNVISEKIALFFGTVRNLNNDYNEKVNDICLKLLERFNQGEAVEVTEEIRGILVDKDAMMSTIQASHEHRNTKIYKREENIMNMYKQRIDQMIADAKQADLERNRKRIDEFIHYFNEISEALKYERLNTNDD